MVWKNFYFSLKKFYSEIQQYVFWGDLFDEKDYWMSEHSSFILTDNFHFTIDGGLRNTVCIRWGDMSAPKSVDFDISML